MKISRRRLHKQRLQKEQEASDFHVSSNFPNSWKSRTCLHLIFLENALQCLLREHLDFGRKNGGLYLIFQDTKYIETTREFSFTVHYGNDIYTREYTHFVLKPNIDYILVFTKKLNKTNDHFGFVRQMRDKFQKATLSELPTHSENLPQEISNR
ncbi:unnamed protein product [Brassica oleracea var. botrytis]